MDDVKTTNNVPEAPESTPEPAEQPAEQASQPEEQTTDTNEPEAPVEPVERQVPLSVLKEERAKRQEYQRKLAEAESKSKIANYDPNDLESVMSHPAVQELIVKQATQELKDFTRTELEKYPNLHPSVKKAILTNPRGYVKEGTQDVENAKLDIQEYLEEVAEESEAQSTPAPKTFQVAKTNVAKTEVPGARPAEVQAIMQKPIDEWTDEDVKLVEDFTKNSK